MADLFRGVHELIVWRARGNRDDPANLGNRYFREEERSKWARADEMEAQRGARPSQEKSVLQKALRPEPCDWVDHCLPLENPACHRKPKGRIEQVHLSHKTPPNRNRPRRSFRGDTDINLYRHNSNPRSLEQGTTVP